MASPIEQKSHPIYLDKGIDACLAHQQNYRQR